MWRGLFNSDKLPTRRFPTEWFYPIVFLWMMVIVALKHSMWRGWFNTTPLKRNFGLVMDIALVVSAIIISLTYLIEIESVCLIDRLNGSRALMIESALADAIQFAKRLWPAGP